MKKIISKSTMECRNAIFKVNLARISRKIKPLLKKTQKGAVRRRRKRREEGEKFVSKMGKLVRMSERLESLGKL